jgi:hypothetical protein
MPDAGNAADLSEGQKAAVLKASTAPLVVLTGGPGCGKTFATKAIVQLWTTQQKDVRLAAPTGAALLPSWYYHSCHMIGKPKARGPWGIHAGCLQPDLRALL